MKLTNFRLKKHSGESKDHRGTMFRYTCYKETAFDHETNKTIIVSRSYQCREFPEIKTHTLEEMKQILSDDENLSKALEVGNQIDQALI